MDWTYYQEGECEGTYDPSFYGPCFSDQGSQENILDYVQDARMNTLINVQVKEGASSLLHAHDPYYSQDSTPQQQQNITPLTRTYTYTEDDTHTEAGTTLIVVQVIGICVVLSPPRLYTLTVYHA